MWCTAVGIVVEVDVDVAWAGASPPGNAFGPAAKLFGRVRPAVQFLTAVQPHVPEIGRNYVKDRPRASGVSEHTSHIEPGEQLGEVWGQKGWTTDLQTVP